MKNPSNLSLEVAEADELISFKNKLQVAFTKRMNELVDEQADERIPNDEEFWENINSMGAVSYKIVYHKEQIGGVVLTINKETQQNSLDFLFVDPKYQDKKVGSKIWHLIEKLYPKTRVWETYTPYFDQRNIHFYVNKCGFCIVEYFCEYHKEQEVSINKKNTGRSMIDESFFRFEKRMG